MASPVKSSPRDAQVMGAILKEMGVTEYEARVVNVMLEFVYRKTIVASVWYWNLAHYALDCNFFSMKDNVIWFY